MNLREYLRGTGYLDIGKQKTSLLVAKIECPFYTKNVTQKTFNTNRKFWIMGNKVMFSQKRNFTLKKYLTVTINLRENLTEHLTGTDIRTQKTFLLVARIESLFSTGKVIQKIFKTTANFGLWETKLSSVKREISLSEKLKP